MMSKIRDLGRGALSDNNKTCLRAQTEIGKVEGDEFEAYKELALSVEFGPEDVAEDETVQEAKERLAREFAHLWVNWVSHRLPEGSTAAFEWTGPVGDQPTLMTTATVEEVHNAEAGFQTKAEMVKQFYLNNWEDETHREVANLLDVSLGTVQNGKDMAREEGVGLEKER